MTPLESSRSSMWRTAETHTGHADQEGGCWRTLYGDAVRRRVKARDDNEHGWHIEGLS
jgi:hypothetical protein